MRPASARPSGSGSWPCSSSAWGRPSRFLNSCSEMVLVGFGAAFGIVGDHQGPQSVPAGIAGRFVAVARVVVAVGAAGRTKSPAILVAQRDERQVGHDEIPDGLLEVDLVVPERIGLVLDRVLLEDLPQRQVEVGLERREAPAADRVPAPPHPTRGHDGSRQALEAEVDREGLVGVDRGRGVLEPGDGHLEMHLAGGSGSTEQVSDVHAKSGHQRAPSASTEPAQLRRPVILAARPANAGGGTYIRSWSKRPGSDGSTSTGASGVKAWRRRRPFWTTPIVRSRVASKLASLAST